MRLVHRGDPAPHDEPGAQSRLGAVGVDEVGPDGADEPGQGGGLADEGGPRVAAGPPVVDLGPLGAHGGGEDGVGRAGDGDPQAGGALGAHEVGDDAGDPAVAGLDRVQDGDGPRVRGAW